MFTMSRRALGSVCLILTLFLTFAAASATSVLAQLVGGTTYPINGVQNPPTSFSTIANAVAYMTTNGVTGTGQVVLELSSGYAGETGPVTIPAITGTSATLGVTFRPAAGYTALTSIAGTASPNQFAILIKGNYLTLDGRAGGTGTNRDWTIRCTGSGSSGLGQSAVRFDNVTNSMTDITVKYCILEAEASNTTSGIVGMATGSGSNTAKNFLITNNLIRSTGVSSTTARGIGIQIANFSNSGNTGLQVRDNQINDFYQNAIRFTGGFPGAVITGNNIFHTAAVTQNSTTEFVAIYFSSTVSAGTVISHNFIHDIQLTNGTTAFTGIYLFNGNTSGNRNKVFNNRINIGAGITATGVPVWGIRDNSVSNALFDIDYNSVYVGGTSTTGAINSAAFRKEVASALNIRNNIFFNARSNSGGTGTHWGISINATSGLTAINYNDYFANGTGGVLGTTDNTATGNKTTLAAWKAAVTADVSSISQNPNYLNPTTNPPDMHLDTTIASQLESGGVAVSGINDDFELDIRQGSGGYSGSGTAPDIGADEFAGLPLDLTAPAISYATLGGSTSTTTRSFSNVTVTDVSGVNGTAGTRPRVYYKKSTDANTFVDNTSGSNGWKYAEANGSGSPFDFTIDYSRINGGVVAPGDAIQYFVVAQDLATPANVGINSGTFAAQPSSVDLTAAAFPIGGTINSYSIVSSISGNFTVGSGGTYATLKAAFDDINAKVVTGNIVLTVLGSGTTETATATLNSVVYEGGTFTITVKPDASALAATPTITGNITGAIVKLNGADNVIIDGSNNGSSSRDLTISNTSTTAASAVIWLASVSAGNGASNNTVKNCNLASGANQQSVTVDQFGIFAGGASIATGTGGADNDNNLFQNNSILKGRWGIYVAGVTGNPNDNVQINDNLVGPAAMGADQIGRGGIVVQHQNGLTIARNEVRNVGVLFGDAAGGAGRVGIGVGDFGWTPTATTITNARVTRNRVHDIIEEKTFDAVGIIVGGSGTPSNNVIDNNMIYAVRANGTSGDQSVGIGIAAGDGDKVVYNSINLIGDIDPGSSTTSTQSTVGIRISSTTPANLTLKNNVVAMDATSNTGTLRHFAIVAPATSYAWGTGGSNNNDFYANPANTQATLGGIGTSVPYTAVTTLDSWRTQFTPNQDAATVAVTPPFVSNTDLHLLTNVATFLESGGTPISGVTTDFDDEARNGSTPDIGLDEGTFTAVISHDVRPAAFVDPTNGGAKISGVAFSPQASFQNDGASSETNVQVRYRILDPGSVEVYNDVQVIPSMPAAGSPITVTFGSVTLSTGGTYTMFAKAELGTDQNTGNDEISGSFEVLAPLAGTYSVGTGQAAPFNSLTGAVARLNQVGISANVVFNLVDAAYSAGETFPITINAYPGTDPGRTVTIKPANPGTSISGSSTSAIIKLNGADYVVLDGSSTGGTSRDLSISNTANLAGTAAVWLSSTGAGAGATNNVIKNLNLSGGVDQRASLSDVFGVISSGASITTGNLGNDNDNNTIQNNAITRVRWGVYVYGATGNVNEGVIIADNLIGPATLGIDQIGKGGIIVAHQNACTISGNEVRNVGLVSSDTASGTDRTGIGLGEASWTPTATAITNSRVTRNRVHDIIDEKTFSAVGITVGGSGTPSNNIIDNNMIYAVRANGTSGDHAVGIGISAGDGDKVVYNSIYLSGDSDPGSSTTSTQSTCGIRIASTTPANLTLKNNAISIDVTSNTATLKHFAIVAPSTSYAWGSGLSDNNDFFPASANAQAVLGGIGTTVPYTEVTSLAAWRTQFTPNQDGASVSANPPFVSATDLHLQSGIPTALEGGGAPVAGVTTDFDNQTRDIHTPDIGLDEGTFSPLLTKDVRATAFLDPTNGGSKSIGIAFSPVASFQNDGTQDQTNVPVRYRILNGLNVEVYNNVQTIASLLSGGGPVSQTFDPVTLGAAGTYTIRARTQLFGDQNGSNDEIVGTIEVLAPLAGTYDVGASQTAPFNTLTSAVARLNQVGQSANVTFRLIDATYTTPAETFPITINEAAGSGASATFTIQPASALAGPVAITGSSTSAILVLNGADYVTVEGSATGGTSRDLTITNSSTSTSSAVVWGQTTAGANPATHNTVRNVNLTGSGNTQTLLGVGFGGTTIATTSNGTGNNANQIRNCNITKTQYGIYSGGASAANKNTGTVIADNAINTVSPNNVTIGGILVRFEDGVEISGNAVGEVSRSSGTDFGISLGFQAASNLLNVTPGDEVTNALVSRNKVATIVSPSTTGFSAVGIAVAAAASGTNTIVNNMVSGVTAPSTPDDFVSGIYVLGAAGGTTRVWFNSVNMTGDRGTGATNPSFALAVAGTNPVIDLRNNALVNTQTTAGTGKSYAIGLATSTYTNLSSNYNDLFSSGASARFAVIGGLTNSPAGERTSLAAWQTETGQDANSISADPLFVANNDLHVNVSGIAVSPTANAGTVIAGVTTDFDGETGNRATTPDIGADEFATYTLITNVVGDGTVAKSPDQPLYNPGTIVTLTASAGPGAVFQAWTGDATGNTNPLAVTLDANKNITAVFAYASQLSVADVSVGEGNAGTTAATFILTLSTASADTVKVNFATADSSATVGNGDYQALSGLAVFVPGVLSDTVTVLVNGDLAIESDELFKLVLSNPVKAGILDGLALGEIVNDDFPAITVNDVSVTEGNAGNVSASFIISLGAAFPDTVKVDFATADSTATLADNDYLQLVGQAVFAPGVLADTVSVQVVGDTTDEANEVFHLLLSNPVNASIADGLGRAVVLNDDAPSDVQSGVPQFSFMGGTYPNPFREQATLEYGLAAAGPVDLRVYDVQGRLVRTLLTGDQAAGYKRTVWDGRDDSGRQVGMGLYFVRLAADHRTWNRRVMLMK